jgi:hypothetical protein
VIISIYCAVDCNVNDTACGIVLETDTGIKKEIGYYLGHSDYELAISKTIRIGLEAINKNHRCQKHIIQLYSDKFILEAMSDDYPTDDLSKPKQDNIKKARDLLRSYGDRKAYVDDNNINIIRAKCIAKICREQRIKAFKPNDNI